VVAAAGGEEMTASENGGIMVKQRWREWRQAGKMSGAPRSAAFARWRLSRWRIGAHHHCGCAVRHSRTLRSRHSVHNIGIGVRCGGSA